MHLKKTIQQHPFSVLAAIAILINFSGCWNELMEPDAALYASIAKNMALSGDWINLMSVGSDWLDKPHLPFWLTALSFKFFGINAIAYRIPALLTWLLGVLYVYQLTKRTVNKEAAQIAVIIYSSALHMYLATFDVRAEAYLTTFISAAIYHVHASINKKWSAHLIAAAAFTGAAMMTKGLFTAITIFSGFVIFWIVNKQHKELFKIKWWLLLLMSVAFTAPELYALYMQFDLHPEKIIFGNTHTSGIRFFLWDSQFGRFFNTGPIKGDGDPFFFVHTFLWAFLPWSFISIVAFFNLKKIKNNLQEKSILPVLLFSFIVTFLLFSFSKFQLPHYIVILFPHVAIIAAAYIQNNLSAVAIKRWTRFHGILLALVACALVALSILTAFFPIMYVLILLMLGAVLIYLFRSMRTIALIVPGVVLSLLLCVYLSFLFYPKLISYQAGLTSAQYVNNEKNKMPLLMYKYNSFTFEFYSNQLAEHIDSMQRLKKKTLSGSPFRMYLQTTNIPELLQNGFDVKTEKEFDNYKVTQLSLDFLNASTRNKTLEKFAIVTCSQKK